MRGGSPRAVSPPPPSSRPLSLSPPSPSPPPPSPREHDDHCHSHRQPQPQPQSSRRPAHSPLDAITESVLRGHLKPARGRGLPRGGHPLREGASAQEGVGAAREEQGGGNQGHYAHHLILLLLPSRAGPGLSVQGCANEPTNDQTTNQPTSSPSASSLLFSRRRRPDREKRDTQRQTTEDDRVGSHTRRRGLKDTPPTNQLRITSSFIHL